jgi:CDP-diacylglycerol--glycerol-3-phosphate 3-phosphatidyltransferase
MNLATKLTLSRVFMIPLFVFFLYFPRVFLFDTIPLNRLIALLIFIAACITDAVDGYIARKRNMVTDLGKFLDPLADKILVISALICLIDIAFIPTWVVVAIVAREFIVTGFRLAVVQKDNKAVIAADIWGKIKTAFTMGAIIAVLVFTTFMTWVGRYILNFETRSGETRFIFMVYNICDIIMYICVVLTVFSGITMIYKNRKLFNSERN